MTGPRAPALAALLLLAWSSGCAVLAEDHRYFARALDDAAPSSDAARVALAPVAIPVGAAALGIDAALVNPVAVFDDAFEAATWAFEVPSTGPLEVFVLPMRFVTFVATLVGAELVFVWVPL